MQYCKKFLKNGIKIIVKKGNQLNLKLTESNMYLLHEKRVDKLYIKK
jgi:hypothetical protein